MTARERDPCDGAVLCAGMAMAPATAPALTSVESSFEYLILTSDRYELQLHTRS